MHFRMTEPASQKTGKADSVLSYVGPPSEIPYSKFASRRFISEASPFIFNRRKFKNLSIFFWVIDNNSSGVGTLIFPRNDLCCSRLRNRWFRDTINRFAVLLLTIESLIHPYLHNAIFWVALIVFAHFSVFFKLLKILFGVVWIAIGLTQFYASENVNSTVRKTPTKSRGCGRYIFRTTELFCCVVGAGLTP